MKNSENEEFLPALLDIFFLCRFGVSSSSDELAESLRYGVIGCARRNSNQAGCDGVMGRASRNEVKI